MKKILLFAAAATMMVACGQTEKLNNDLVNNEAPRVIGFNTISDKPTRASIESLETYHNTFAVWSTKESHNTHAIEPVFNGDLAADLITFDATKQEPNNWTYSPYRYWDKQATYNFVAVAPNSQIIKYNNAANVANNEGTYVTTNAAGYTLVGQNLQTSAAPAQEEIKVGFVGGEGDTDLMTAGKIERNGAAAIEDVSFEFKHILAKLNIAIAKDPIYDNVKVVIKDVTVSGLDDNGTYNEGISNQNSAWVSSASANAANYKLAWANTNGIELLKGTGEGDSYEPGKFLYFVESLVMPQAIDEYTEDETTHDYIKGEYLTINYSIVSETLTQNFNYVLKFKEADFKVFGDNFQERNNYTLFLTVRPNVITFDAATSGWEDKSASSNIVPPTNL